MNISSSSIETKPTFIYSQAPNPRGSTDSASGADMASRSLLPRGHVLGHHGHVPLHHHVYPDDSSKVFLGRWNTAVPKRTPRTYDLRAFDFKNE